MATTPELVFLACANLFVCHESPMSSSQAMRIELLGEDADAIALGVGAVVTST